MNEFEKYKEFKDKCDFVYEGIHVNKAIAISIWHVANQRNKSYYNIRYFINFVRKLTVPQMKFKKDQTILSTYGRYNRPDYKELYRMVIGKLDNTVASFDTLEWKYSFYINFQIIFAVLKFFLFKKLGNISLMDRLGLISETVYFCYFIKDLKKNDYSQIKKYLSQCDHYNIENVMTQFFKLHGINTLSLIEGVCCVYKKNIPLDCIHYENFETDKLLVWGQYTYDEYVNWGIPKNNIVVAGYPKSYKIIGMKQSNTYKKCMVLLARDAYRSSNVSLLDILKESNTDTEYCLKLHPGSDFKFYTDYAQKNGMVIIPKEVTVQSCLNNEKFDFAIAVNTSAYFDALIQGVPCLRFKDNSFEITEDYDDFFHDKIEYEKVLNQLKSIELNQYQKDVYTILKHHMGMGIDNYREEILS
ncbi:MAG TPA: hypothetical protein PLN63_00600 [Paludibacteraceae bacterium]|jgi:hypothetical protein|nr:hypothetical protein [Paludibacteraceae bacterium]HPH62112.1 hypothetical protein [Paludibacteraceae bacterium]